MSSVDHLSIWHLIAQADPIVKLVMLILLLGSIVSWAIIFQRNRLLKKEVKAYKGFEAQFWSGKSLSEIYQRLSKAQAETGATAIFSSGYSELGKLQKRVGLKPDAVMSGMERAMKVTLMRESDRLQNGLSLLATIGSVSPYVGLFGTVWGIMNAFQSLGAVQQATLAMVAPGISEALVATAMGLFVAIPAVIAYNRFVARSERILNEFENFQDEFTGLVHREVYSTGAAQ